ncbi:MAG: hypothetical protein ACLUB3_01215 [Clostridium sp.]
MPMDINGENQAEMDLTNRMLRISVHGTDMILRKDVADIQLSFMTVRIS